MQISADTTPPPPRCGPARRLAGRLRCTAYSIGGGAAILRSRYAHQAPPAARSTATPPSRRIALEGLLAGPVAENVRLHPNMADLYRAKIGELEVALNDDSVRTEAQAALRSLIREIRLTPNGTENGPTVELAGDLAAALELSMQAKKHRPASTDAGQISLVAEGRYALYRTVMRLPPRSHVSKQKSTDR